MSFLKKTKEAIINFVCSIANERISREISKVYNEKVRLYKESGAPHTEGQYWLMQREATLTVCNRLPWRWFLKLEGNNEDLLY